MLPPALTGLVAGIVAGSFGNSLVHRLPRRMMEEWQQAAQEQLGLPVDAPSPALTARRSHCPHCNTKIRWYNNIPVVSWLKLGGKCADCGAPISVRYLLLELAGAGIGAGVTALFGLTAPAAFIAAAAFLLLWASAIDIEHQLLPDVLVFPVMWLGLTASAFHLVNTPSSAILGGLTGFLLLALPAMGYHALRGIDGMGFGDAKLLMATGTFLGPQAVIFALLEACVMVLLAHGWSMLRKTHEKGQAKPFGQWLAAASAAVFVGQALHLVPW